MKPSQPLVMTDSQPGFEYNVFQMSAKGITAVVTISGGSYRAAAPVLVLLPETCCRDWRKVTGSEPRPM